MKGQGKAYQWLLAHVDYEGEGCLRWPFAIDRANGRGSLGHNGKHPWAHRLMCQLVHGDPPTPKHQAAHSCGKGHEACVHPKHLDWKTRSENHLDCRQHGTQSRTRNGNKGALTPEQVEQVRALRGVKLQKDIAKMFGVSPSAISHVWAGRTFSRQSKIIHWYPDEDDKLREGVRLGLSKTKLVEFIGGRTEKAITKRGYVLGLSFRPA